MDAVSEIKARLPIEELVSRYCKVERKGRSMKALCPFHNDTHPSLIISPGKGIAYCFACQSGGDIFGFYQKIEGVDFQQALKDLGERTGVEVGRATSPLRKDEKDRLRACLEAASSYFRRELRRHEGAKSYLQGRGVTEEEITTFAIGFAPDQPSSLYDTLLKEGFSRREILDCGLGVQRELQKEYVYDRFRSRVMFPIADSQGRIIGFGGRAFGEVEPKYTNSPETPLYRKAGVLFGLHLAKDAMRESKNVTIVEGYFDVLACYRVGLRNVVAPCGTALTEEHASILKRTVEKVILCFDQDRAGREASERAFMVLAKAGLSTYGVPLREKDPADSVLEDSEGLRETLSQGGRPYLDLVLHELSQSLDCSSLEGKRQALKILLPLMASLQSAVERSHYLDALSSLLGTTVAALEEDLARAASVMLRDVEAPEDVRKASDPHAPFSKMEVALGLFLLYPGLRTLLKECIPPEEPPFVSSLYQALAVLPQGESIDALEVPLEHRERLAILQLFCEEHGFAEWSEGKALNELRRNVRLANRQTLSERQRIIGRKLLEARKEGRAAEEEQLRTQMNQVLKLAKMAT